MDQSLPQLPVNTTHKFVNVSSSPYTWVFFGCILYSNHCLTLCRNGCCQEESLYQAAGCYAKTTGRENLEGSGSANPSSKRKQPEKLDRQPSKKPKVAPEHVLGLKAEGKKMVTKLVHGKGKWLMTGSVPSVENHSSSFVKTWSMRWSGFRPSQRLTIMKTWATTQPRPWGRRVSFAMLR